MTIQEIRVKFFEWFEEHDSFEIKRDFLSFSSIVEDPEEMRAGTIEALKDLEEYKFVRGCEIDIDKELYEAKEGEPLDEAECRKYYILLKPMSSFEQTVSLGAGTSRYVAETINNFCDYIGDHRDFADPAEIKEKDIQNLVHIISMMEKQNIQKKLDEL